MCAEGSAAEPVVRITEEALDGLLRDALDLLHVEQHLVGAKLVKEAVNELDSAYIGRNRR